MPQSTPQRFALLLALACLALAAVAPVAAAKNGTAGIVVSPRPGQSVGGDHVAIVIKAGPAGSDLRANLNGTPIGLRFAVGDGGRRRVLRASAADGLRRGRNVLRVEVDRRRGDPRRATVHFSVSHKKPLAAAGIDRRVVVGSRFELHGMLRLAKSDPGRRRLRWDVVKAPARSALSRPSGSAARSTAEAGAFAERRTLSPTFRPDVRGRYKVRLTAITGNGTSSDTTTIYAVPSNPLLTLKTAVPPTASEPQPGIQVGGETLRAPYMRTSGGQGSYAGTFEGVHYTAMWQLVAYDRATMALKWNRTYGICSGNANLFPCMIGPKGNPVYADLAKELAEAGPETLVVAASHPSGATPALAWGKPDEYGYLSTSLTGIGLPNESIAELVPQLVAAGAGEMAAVGYPGLATGAAKFIIGGGQIGLNGYLTPDSNAPKHYFYVPAAREPFDTQVAGSCGTQSCTVAQKVGANVVNGSIIDGQGGFLVSGFDRHTLAPIEHQAFATAGGVDEGELGISAVETGKMAAYLKALAAKGALVVISTIHATGQNPAILFARGTPAATWQALSAAIVGVGGTREKFNTAATTANAEYALVGYAGLAEGAGNEDAGVGARLRGALVPDARSQFEPTGVTSGETAPNELLVQIAMRAPQPAAWPLAGNKEAEAAISALGAGSKQLGPNPRAAFWTQLTSASIAGKALAEVQEEKWQKGAPYSQKAFGEAKAALEVELKEVGTTREYMTELAQPLEKSGQAGWDETPLIAAELEEGLKRLKEQGKAKAEYLAIVDEILEALSLGAGIKEWAKAAQFLAGAAIAAEVGQTTWSADPSGAAGEPGVTVEALKLGLTLRAQAEDNAKFFERLGDIIVADPTKLGEVGVYGGCNPDGGCGNYEGLAHDEEMGTVARAAILRGFDREIYERLVPRAYPIWNTGTSISHEAVEPPQEFKCSDDSYPFEGAPELAYHRALWEVDPTTGTETWRVFLSVARSERTYGWPSETMLKRMFEPVPVTNSNADEGGLGIDPGAFMRQGLKINEYDSGWVCNRPKEVEREMRNELP